ncbi:MAG: methyl-accepting chemotaxis protein, partial [Methanomicrobium sp.]|nr:methyl-accepting chemotaxis protein [Methanomicrobium sp.]
KAYEDMAGISDNDAKRMNLRDFEILEKSGDGISKVLKTGKRSLSELKIKLPAGIRFLKQYGIPIRKNGQVSEILIVYVDITHEMNKAEEIKSQMKEIDVLKKRSETIVQQNPMPIILLSKNLDILVSNNSFEKISGIERHALLKMNLKDFIFEDKKGDDISTVFSSKKRSYGEVSFKTPLGTHVLEQYAIPIMDERENISTVLVVYNEITRLRKNEKDLQELMEKVQKEAVCLEESAKEITSGMLELADKNLNIRSKISDNDPLKILKENFNNSVLSIKELIRDIASKTDNIEETADGLFKNNESISDAAQKMAQNAYESFDFTEDLTKHFEKISNGISDLSASIEEISSTTQDVMQKTLYAEKEGREAAAIGKEAFDKMEAVGEISKKSVQEINSLNYEIEKINDIVKLINGIAEQTNMLALNAAIEAARAGENGRGFAVVAGEVKNLAGESKKATLQIQELITSIQKNSQNTTDSMHHVDEEIKVGIKSTNAAIEALNKIVEEIVVASGSMTEISKATDIQAQETNVFMQLVDAANEINRENKKRTENITALAEEISSTTDEVGEISNSMHEMSIELKDAMNKFRIE